MRSFDFNNSFRKRISRMIDSTQLINFRPGKDGDVPFESNVIIDKRKN